MFIIFAVDFKFITIESHAQVVLGVQLIKVSMALIFDALGHFVLDRR